MIPRDIILSDGVITVRPPTLDDATAMAAAVRESVEQIRPWMGWAIQDYDIDSALRYIQSVPGQWERGENYQFFIFSASEERMLGGCGLNHLNKVYNFANLGYWVRTGATRQGIASRAARLVAQFGFEQVKLHRAEIVVAVGNQPSLRAAEKAGAHREGVLRNRMILESGPCDAVMHSLVPQDFED